ncbi:hypothetical protein AVEN_145386-1 [Araneus ventricosus]|uniref:Uncharacterized protein n=1 Tax=Araneus ventricosus TaxID=182803 RepID=A0A4Y2TF63_ARAVE|nr:hypothetical protein AVEN_145386-1 [Araneus ventricosus]
MNESSRRRGSVGVCARETRYSNAVPEETISSGNGTKSSSTPLQQKFTLHSKRTTDSQWGSPQRTSVTGISCRATRNPTRQYLAATCIEQPYAADSAVKSGIGRGHPPPVEKPNRPPICNFKPRRNT